MGTVTKHITQCLAYLLVPTPPMMKIPVRLAGWRMFRIMDATEGAGLLHAGVV